VWELLGVVDDDEVSLSNLQRQILHDTANVGMDKTESAARALKRLNPHVRVVTHALRLTPDNATDIITAYDMVVDGSDNFDTRYLLADTCEALKSRW
jgi:molybdopterin/thiamine biosynthesis adenylyltransferase